MYLTQGWGYRSMAIAVAAIVGLSTPVMVVAQDANVLEEITVTARKRVENLQDVALSVSAMSQQEIKANFATDVRDLIYISPNTLLDDTNQGPGGVAAVYIRGIGVSEVEKNFDPAVGVVVDGVFLGTMTGSITRAIDLESLEVLRGPQGTLFGRNTIGGVIKMTRSKPTMTLGGKVRAQYGDYDTTVLDGIVNFGNGDTFGVKLSGAYRNQDEGYFTNTVTGRDDGQYEYTSGGVNLLWVPTDGVELEWTSVIERTDQDSSTLLNLGQPGQVFCDGFGACAPDTRTPISGDRYAVDQSFENLNLADGTPIPDFDHSGKSPFDSTFDADTHQLEVRWDINDDYRLDYIGASWETEETVITDWDGHVDLFFHTDRPADYEQLTNELRLTYDAGGKLVYTVGAYLWDSEYEISLISWIGFAGPALLLELPQFSKQESDSWALFFEGDYDFTDKWTLTLGGRFTDDEKKTDQRGVVPCGQPVLPPEFVAPCAADFFTPITAEEDWSEFTPKVALRYTINEDSMVYGLYSRGYRAGGFNGRVDAIPAAVDAYDPETVDNFELGYRSTWLGDTLVFNATAFYMDYQDKQEEIQQPSATSGTGQVTRVFNASDATIIGAEFEVAWLATAGLTIRSSLGLLDADYDNFLVNTGPDEGPPVLTDFSHLDFRRAPEITFGLSGDYRWGWGPGSARLWANLRYLDEHEVDFANKPELTNSSQSLIDASFTYELNQWYGSVFGRNLTDEDGYQIGFDVAGLWSYAAPRAPRTWGVEIGMRFGEQ